jgi:uncharacterized membrane protein
MEKSKHNYMKHPNKKVLLIFLVLWIISTFLIILSITNFFTESFFNSRFTLMYYLIIFSSVSAIKLILNYKKTINKPTLNE